MNKEAIPFNQEHLEAQQESANKTTDAVAKAFSSEDKIKLAAINQAVKILVEAKIKFYLFPELATGEANKKQVWQWNSILEFTEFDSKGAFTQKSISQNILFHSMFYSQVFNLIWGYVKKINPEVSFFDFMDFLPRYIHSNLEINKNYLDFNGDEEDFLRTDFYDKYNRPSD